MVFFFTACVSKKSTVEYRDRVVTDTVIVKKNVEVIKSIRDTLIIEEPCDSLGNLANFNQVLSWKPLFKPYLIHYFEKGGSGADVGPLKTDKNVLAGLRPDSQRYFDYHHASNDTFDAVNKRELELGAATMTALVYLFDKYGVK